MKKPVLLALYGLFLAQLPAKAEFSPELFQQRLRQFAAYAAPLVQARGYGLRLFRDPDWDRNLGDCVLEESGQLLITVGDRLYEMEGLAPDHFDVILCHELGHLLGGAPKKKNYFNRSGDWASVEGESDYFAASCVQELEGSVSRAARAAEGFYQLLYSHYAPFTGEPKPVLSGKDESVVFQTMEGHPLEQCRLDSFVAGLTRAPRPRCWYKPE